MEEIPSTDHIATNPLDQENTLAQPVYEAYYQNLIKDKVIVGTVLQSDTTSYTVIRARSCVNIFEVRQEGKEQRKYTVKLYDYDDVHKFQNEVEKLDLLNQIEADMGVKEQGLLL